MFLIKFHLFVIFAFCFMDFSGTQSQIYEQKLQVLVLFETLCPHSRWFIIEQLGRGYESIKDYVDITLVPFGKAKSYDSGDVFDCQHGDAECKGNRAFSCVIMQTGNQEQQVRFVVCQMASPDVADVKYCAESVGLSSEIETCMNTDMGTYLQLLAEETTQLYAPSFVPTVIYDEVFNQRLQTESMRNFYRTVCVLLARRGVRCEPQYYMKK